MKGTARPSNLALCLKILAPRKILQKLPIAHAQVKSANPSKNFLKEIGKKAM